MPEITLENISKMRGKIKLHEGGSVFLGIFDADLTIDVGELEPIQIRLPGLIARLNVAQEPSIAYPTRKWETEDGEKRLARVYSAGNDLTHACLVKCAFAVPEVDRRVSKALVMQAAVEQEEAAA